MAIVDELFAKLGLDLDETGFARGAAAVAGLRGGMVAVGAAVVGLAGSLAAAVKATVDYGSKVNDLSDRTGESTATIQALGYAASLSGSNMEDLARAMNFAAKRGVKDLEGEIAAVADRIKELTDKGRGAEAAALAMQRFGKGGAALVGTLKQGSARIRELASEAQALGVVLDKDTIAAADDLGDEIDKAGYAIRGLTYTIAKGLLPIVQKVVGAFVEWVKANREFLAAKIERVLVAVSIALGVLLVRMVALKAAVFFTTLAWLAFAAVLAIVIDDVYTFFTGGESLIGRFLAKFNELLAPQPEDGVIGYLKAYLRFIRDAFKASQDLIGLWEKVKGAVPELVFGRRAGSGVQFTPEGAAGVAGLFGGGASPSATVSSGFPGGGIQLQSPQVTQTVNINPPPGVSATESGKAAMDRSWRGIDAALEAAREGAR